MRRRSRAYSCLFVLLASSVSAISQTVTNTAPAVNSVSDAAAVTLVQQANLALTGAAVVTDLTANANAAWLAGRTSESGAATLASKGAAQARLDIAAGAVTKSEIRNDTNGPGGQWLDAKGTAHPFAVHNCWTPATWFAPHAIIAGLLQTNTVLKYAGAETRDGSAVDHVQAYRVVNGQKPKMAAEIQKLSTVDLFLDKSTHVPLFISFNSHPDDNLLRDIPVEIRFSDYRSANGILVPYRIQRLLSGSPNLDLIVTSVALNTGIPDTSFALQ